MKNKKPRVLLLDIETAPILGYAWGLHDQNIGLNQIKQDWFVISWAAKWLDQRRVLYKDQRYSKDKSNDKALVKAIWELIDEADILITQNGKRFDIKKLNARFVKHGLKPPSSFRHIDTLQLAKKHFAFTSNKLEYMSDQLCSKHKKRKVRKFIGFELWKECLSGNMEAWKEMEKYNKKDVLSLEELYKKLIPWDNTINVNVYTDEETISCMCGSSGYKKNGYNYTQNGKYQRYRCMQCGAEFHGAKNLFSLEKKKSFLKRTVR